jgi:hypothetical protein
VKDEAGFRHLRRFAEWLSCQRSSPPIDHDLVDMAFWDLADNVLAWLDAPHDEQGLLAMLQSRSDFRECCRFTSHRDTD